MSRTHDISTKRARHRVTSLMYATLLLLSQAASGVLVEHHAHNQEVAGSIPSHMMSFDNPAKVVHAHISPLLSRINIICYQPNVGGALQLRRIANLGIALANGHV